MEFRTIEGVEIATVGMEWPAMTGPVTVTFDNLADAAVAANDDPHVVVPRAKLGHEDPRFQDQSHNWDPTWDGEPAFGRFVNLRLENDGAVLVGDLVECPAWLADAAPSGFPNRSMECIWSHTTEGGKTYSMVITAVALLGPYGPAIRDLEDLERVMTEGDPGLLEAIPAAARSEEDTRVPQPAAASISTSQVREEFNFSWATSEPLDGIDTYWWWARDIRVDPNEVIADDDEGGLWLVPFTTNGTEEIEFGQPVKVREEFVPLAQQPEQVAASAQLKDGQKTLASFTRPSKQDKTAAARSESTQEEGTVPLTDDQRATALEKYDVLTDDSTDEEIIQAMLDGPAANAEPEGEPDDDDPTGQAESEVEGDPVGVSARGVVIDKDAYAQLQADAAAGREARQEQLNTARGAFIQDAVKQGKFPPAAAEAYREQLDKGGAIETATREFIDGLAENTVPVQEAGAVPSETAAASEGTGWFPQLKKEA